MTMTKTTTFKTALWTGLCLVIATGCATTETAEQKEKDKNKYISLDPPKIKSRNVVVAPSSEKRALSAVRPEAPPQARVLPVNGKVAMVNDNLRFVIIDFMNSRQPRLEQKLGVYRVGQKVAEIRVSGPYRNTTVAADILAGEAKYGDEVRAE